MHDILRGAIGDYLPLNSFLDAAEEDFWRTGEPGFWKLERLQTFAEPDNASWVAFDQGDWAESMRLIEQMRTGFTEYYRRIAERGFATWRVRVVQRPLTPYLRWELHVLRLRDEHGAHTRVIGPERVRGFESGGVLPEIFTYGHEVMYQGVYDEQNALAGAWRFTDRELVARCQRFIQGLYRQGEELSEFFDREVAALGAPCGR